MIYVDKYTESQTASKRNNDKLHTLASTLFVNTLN